MTWEYVGELILSIRYTQTEAPNLALKQVFMMLIALFQ